MNNNIKKIMSGTLFISFLFSGSVFSQDTAAPSSGSSVALDNPDLQTHKTHYSNNAALMVIFSGGSDRDLSAEPERSRAIIGLLSGKFVAHRKLRFSRTTYFAEGKFDLKIPFDGNDTFGVSNAQFAFVKYGWNKTGLNVTPFELVLDEQRQKGDDKLFGGSFRLTKEDSWKFVSTAFSIATGAGFFFDDGTFRSIDEGPSDEIIYKPLSISDANISLLIKIITKDQGRIGSIGFSGGVKYATPFENVGESHWLEPNAGLDIKVNCFWAENELVKNLFFHVGVITMFDYYKLSNEEKDSFKEIITTLGLGWVFPPQTEANPF